MPITTPRPVAAGGQAARGGRAPGAGGGAAAAATAAAIETVAVETVTYQRGPTRSSRHRRRGSRCPNSRPELQVTDATAPGPARPGSTGGGGDPYRGSGSGQRSPCRSPQTYGMARPRDLPPHPESRQRGGVWSGRGLLLPFNQTRGEVRTYRLTFYKTS